MDALLDGPKPIEEVTWAMWQLGQVGSNRFELYYAVRLLRQMPWSQVRTEHGHGAAAIVMKTHRLHGATMLQSKSMLKHMSVLVHACPEQQKLDKLRSALARAQQRVPQRGGGRQIFLGELISTPTELATGGASAHVKIAKLTPAWSL